MVYLPYQIPVLKFPYCPTLLNALLEKHSNVMQNYTEQTILAEQNTRTRDLYSVKLTPNRLSRVHWVTVKKGTSCNKWSVLIVHVQIKDGSLQLHMHWSSTAEWKAYVASYASIESCMLPYSIVAIIEINVAIDSRAEMVTTFSGVTMTPTRLVRWKTSSLNFTTG